MGGKLSPLDPKDSPGKRDAAAEERFTPICELPWLSLLLRLLLRISPGLRRWSLSCLLRSPVSLFCKAPSSPAGAVDGDGSSLLIPAAAAVPVDEV